MADANSQELGFAAKLVVAIGIALAVAGVLWRGVAMENFARIWHNMVESPSGPMAFRFILQPTWRRSPRSSMASRTGGAAAHRISGRC